MMKTVNKSNGELLNQYSSYLNSGKISAKTKERILKTLGHPDYRNIISEFFSKNKDKIDLSDENEVLAALSEKFDQEDMSQGEKKMYIKTILKEISQKFSKQKTLSNKTYKYITNQEGYADFLKKDKKEKKELELERKRIENQKRMIEACTDPSVAYQHYKSNIQQTEEIEAKKIQTIAADLWKNKWIELEEAIAKKCKKFFEAFAGWHRYMSYTQLKSSRVLLSDDKGWNIWKKTCRTLLRSDPNSGNSFNELRYFHNYIKNELKKDNYDDLLVSHVHDLCTDIEDSYQFNERANREIQRRRNERENRKNGVTTRQFYAGDSWEDYSC